MTRRRYPVELKAEAVGLAQSIGVTEAARRLNLPHRTLSHWAASPDMRAIILRSRDDVAAKLWEAVVVGTEAVLAGLRDPDARLSDKARALEVVAQQHALLVGDVTARTETSATRSDLSDLADDDADTLRTIVTALLGADDETLAKVHDGEMEARDVTLG